MLFAHSRQDLSKDLLVHTDISLHLTAKGRKIHVGARIIRKFKDTDWLYVGLQFMEIAPEDFRFLFELIYGKPFQDEYEDRWEGGIPPPALTLD